MYLYTSILHAIQERAGPAADFGRVLLLWINPSFVLYGDGGDDGDDDDDDDDENDEDDEEKEEEEEEERKKMITTTVTAMATMMTMICSPGIRGNTDEQLILFTMMKTRCGVKQGLWKCWFRLQNEIKTRWGDSKNEVGLKRD